MTLGDSYSSAVRAIAANKLRSALTMLGVIIGVGSVIAMIGIGEGTKRKSLETIEVMGTNMITIMPDWRRGGQGGGSANSTLRDEDVELLKKEVPLIREITGAVRGNGTVKFGSRSAQTSILGAEPQIAIIRNATKMLQGSWYTSADDEAAERKVVLGYQVYEQLFGQENAVGTTIKIRGQNYEVTGVVVYKGGSGFMNPDDSVYIPLKTAQRRLLGKTTLDMISMQASNTELMPITQTKVEDTLASRHRSASGEAQFRVMNQGDMIEQIQTQSRLLSLLLAGIASVSLLVGGIGIMNIMLVSVTERTREIGLRKAIGARSEGILTQFLLESIVMCVLGGVIGIALGSVGVIFVSKALQVPPVTSTTAIVTAFFFSVFVGVFFGLYPAMRASRLEPIQALRHE